MIPKMRFGLAGAISFCLYTNASAGSLNTDPANVASAAKDQIPPVQTSGSVIQQLHMIVLNSPLELDSEQLNHLFDVKVMARKVLGRHWRAASKEQRVTFTREFQRYLQRYLARLFEGVTAVTPHRQSASQNDYWLLKPEQRIRIDYRISDSQQARIEDLVVDKVSLIISNQQQYNVWVREEGLETVLAKMAYNNREASD